ncbi:MAG: hypothetical protein KC417_07280 [Myxococcales bacterium]|nr:hypothetical protein [Myxococcales bacterium]
MAAWRVARILAAAIGVVFLLGLGAAAQPAADSPDAGAAAGSPESRLGAMTKFALAQRAEATFQPEAAHALYGAVLASPDAGPLAARAKARRAALEAESGGDWAALGLLERLRSKATAAWGEAELAQAHRALRGAGGGPAADAAWVYLVEAALRAGAPARAAGLVDERLERGAVASDVCGQLVELRARAMAQGGDVDGALRWLDGEHRANTHLARGLRAERLRERLRTGAAAAAGLCALCLLAMGARRRRRVGAGDVIRPSILAAVFVALLAPAVATAAFGIALGRAGAAWSVGVVLLAGLAGMAGAFETDRSVRVLARAAAAIGVAAWTAGVALHVSLDA